MTPAAFRDFFSRINGYEPFPWQARLAERVLGGQGWPGSLMLPTGAGKTAVIDVAVFALASQAQEPARTTPRRIFFVVDRRVVVDEAFRRAQSLAARLQAALTSQDGIVSEVARRLMQLGGEVPLAVAAMRGGMYLNHDWARHPAQPMVCVSTVDQVGSRLLFRGYGIDSSRPNNMLPIHAALLGMDALIILDEAHMSAAFAETLRWVARYRTWGDRCLEMPWHVMVMSATLSGQPADLTLDDNDRCHPVLCRRLNARKPTRLIEVGKERKAHPSTSEEEDSEARKQRQLVEALCAEADRLVRDEKARVVGIVVNRVMTARQVFERLRSLEHADAVLLTGRTRPIDRDSILDRYLPRMRAGRDRSSEDRPLFVVATQTIEVGADLDFDALVTECAPLDSLRQRFGRLNRLGHLDSAPAAIVVRADQASRHSTDPIYGEALARTWAWLKRIGGTGGMRQRRGSKAHPPVVDMGIAALEEQIPPSEDLEALCAPRRAAPVVLPGHLDLWVQTSPTPCPDPEVAVFLHGPDAIPADVQVVWRSDLDLSDPESWADIVALLPPLSAEAMAIPLPAVRRWLEGGRPMDLADLEGALPDSAERRLSQVRPRPVLRWAGAGSDGTRLIQPGEIMPGDTIVVPADYGGADEFGWAPDSRQPVRDVSIEAYRRGLGQYVLRLHPRVFSELVNGRHIDETALEELEQLRDMLTSSDDELSEVAVQDLADKVLSELAGFTSISESVRAITTALLSLDKSRRHVIPYPDGQGLIIVGRVEPTGLGLTDEADASIFANPVGLDEHQRAVEATVDAMARACGLPEDLRQDLLLAARYHDVGKADPRFQVVLHRGDEVAAATGPPLAKSGDERTHTSWWRAAWERSGLPRGYRHEAVSLAWAERHHVRWKQAHDPELVLHLIASHHGCGRPFLPPVADPGGGQVRIVWEGTTASVPSDGKGALDSGVAERFWRLNRRYGWYGLAYLEALLRLADHRASEKVWDQA